jgi:hypothetical protein
MEKTKEDYQAPTGSVSIDTLSTFSIPVGLKKNVKKKINEISEKTVNTLAEQIYYIQGKYDEVNGWFLTWEQLGSIFGKNATQARNFYEKGKKYISNGGYKKPGRPTMLNLKQEEELIEWLDTKYKEHDPPAASDIVIYIKNRYNVDVHDNWPYDFRERYKTKVVECSAQPLEPERAEVTYEQLKEYDKKVNEKLNVHEKDYVWNWDEVCLDNGTPKPKTVFIPAKYEKQKTYYKAPREPSHITFLFCISLSGKKLPPLVIITGKSYDSDLEQFGIGGIDIGTEAVIVHTDSGYINAAVLLEYVKKVAIPYWEKNLDLKTNKLLLLQDSMTAHTDAGVLNELKLHNVETFELVPHASHLLQPLDQGSFSQWKGHVKRRYFSNIGLTPRSLRIYNGLRCFEKVSGFLHNIMIFRNAGIFYNANTTPTINFNINTILAKGNAPAVPPGVSRPIKIKVKPTRKRIAKEEVGNEKKKKKLKIKKNK